MFVGIPKEIKDNEFRVSLSPRGVRELISHGHQVIVQKNAGHEIGFEDSQYSDVGALIAQDAKEVFDRAELIIKVKEPQLAECSLLRERQIIFSYLHLAAEPHITKALLESKCIAIAYETITSSKGDLPLLAPMSEVAGRVAVQAGASCLERTKQGRGVLLGGVPGVAPGNVVIIGGGTVGMHSAIIASGMGASVTLFERSMDRIRTLKAFFDHKVNVLYSTVDSLEAKVAEADLVIGAVLIPGDAAPKVVTEEMVKKMKRGAVIVDVAIDQGGCIETARPTTHSNPTYIEHGVVHYCVTNMPSAVARTASSALENATLPYIITLANAGYRHALTADDHFLNGLNVYRGHVTYEAVAKALNHAYVPATSLLNPSS